MPGVGGRGPDRGRLELPEDAEQPLGGHGACVDRQRAELLRAEHAGSADEQREVERVAIAVLGPQARRPELPGFVVDPVVEVLRREGRSGRHAGRAAGGGDVDDIAFGRGAKVAERRLRKLPVAQHLLVDEREALQVVERFRSSRMDARSVEMGCDRTASCHRRRQMPLEVSQALALQEARLWVSTSASQ